MFSTPITPAAFPRLDAYLAAPGPPSADGYLAYAVRSFPHVLDVLREGRSTFPQQITRTEGDALRRFVWEPEGIAASEAGAIAGRLETDALDSLLDYYFHREGLRDDARLAIVHEARLLADDLPAGAGGRGVARLERWAPGLSPERLVALLHVASMPVRVKFLDHFFGLSEGPISSNIPAFRWRNEEWSSRRTELLPSLSAFALVKLYRQLRERLDFGLEEHSNSFWNSLWFPAMDYAVSVGEEASWEGFRTFLKTHHPDRERSLWRNLLRQEVRVPSLRSAVMLYASADPIRSIFPEIVKSDRVSGAVSDLALDRVVPAHLIGEDASQKIDDIRLGIVWRLRKAGWREGEVPSSSQLEQGLREEEAERRQLPVISKPGARWPQRILLDGHHRIASLISLVADGLLPKEALSSLPFDEDAALDTDAIVHAAFTYGEAVFLSWADVAAFHPPSRALLSNLLPTPI